jgi:hypothetical protein
MELELGWPRAAELGGPWGDWRELGLGAGLACGSEPNHLTFPHSHGPVQEAPKRPPPPQKRGFQTTSGSSPGFPLPLPARGARTGTLTPTRSGPLSERGKGGPKAKAKAVTTESASAQATAAPLAAGLAGAWGKWRESAWVLGWALGLGKTTALALGVLLRRTLRKFLSHGCRCCCLQPQRRSAI